MKAPARVSRVPRSPKGARTEQSVIEAAAALLEEGGLAGVSQEQVAQSAGISQSTLRHYFPTKDDLVEALFERTFAGYYAAMEAQLLEAHASPGARLARLIRAHLAHITRASDAFAFEGFAYFTRDDDARERRDDWYRWLLGQYAALIGQLSPELSPFECDARAYALLTLCLGAWVTLGRSRPALINADTQELRAQLLAAASAIVGAELVA
jgi:AcrR family transcriptional regulator